MSKVSRQLAPGKASEAYLPAWKIMKQAEIYVKPSECKKLEKNM